MTEKIASPLLTEDDAAGYLLTSPKTLANWRWRGVGPEYVKLGGSVRYRPEALDAYIASRTRGRPQRRRPELVGEGGR
jgi:predicted DNA-binding transcriptional regulator AlpA